jgi:2-aminoadipate transaminase
VDTGSFRAVARQTHDGEFIVGPANSDTYEDGRA